jgi:hypothetical protein
VIDNIQKAVLEACTVLDFLAGCYCRPGCSVGDKALLKVLRNGVAKAQEAISGGIYDDTPEFLECL